MAHTDLGSSPPGSNGRFPTAVVLWGEVIRVTEYGAFVDVGAVVDGFLHIAEVGRRCREDLKERPHASSHQSGSAPVVGTHHPTKK